MMALEVFLWYMDSNEVVFFLAKTDNSLFYELNFFEAFTKCLSTSLWLNGIGR